MSSAAKSRAWRILESIVGGVCIAMLGGVAGIYNRTVAMAQDIENLKTRNIERAEQISSLEKTISRIDRSTSGMAAQVNWLVDLAKARSNP